MEEDHQRVPGPTVGSLKWSSFGPKKWPCTETRIFTWFKVYVFKRTAYHMKTQCCYFTVLYHQNMKKDDINRRLFGLPQNHKNVLFDNTHMEPSVVWRENVKWPILDTLKKGSKRGWKQGPPGVPNGPPEKGAKKGAKTCKKADAEWQTFEHFWLFMYTLCTKRFLRKWQNPSCAVKNMKKGRKTMIFGHPFGGPYHPIGTSYQRLMVITLRVIPRPRRRDNGDEHVTIRT